MKREGREQDPWREWRGRNGRVGKIEGRVWQREKPERAGERWHVGVG